MGFGVRTERPGKPQECISRDSELSTPKLFATFWLQKVGPSGSEFLRQTINKNYNKRKRALHPLSFIR